VKLAAPSSARSVRTILAALSGVVGAVVFRLGVGSKEGSVWIPVVALAVACGAAFIPHLGAQLLARALWWSNLVLGVILCVLGSGGEHAAGYGLTIGTGVSLVLADRRTLAAAAEAADFRPAAYAGTIELIAVLALADAQTLFLFTALSLDHDHASPAPYFFACAIALVVGFVGVYKLRLWGVIVTMTTAAVLAIALALKMIPHVDKEMDRVLWILCTAQIFAPVPMLISIARKRPLAAPSPRIRSMVASGFVVLVVAFALLYSAFH
jgi:hypothetical protein